MKERDVIAVAHERLLSGSLGREEAGSLLRDLEAAAAGLSRHADLLRVADLLPAVRQHIPVTALEFARAEVMEGNIRLQLAETGGDVSRNLQGALALFQAAKARLADDATRLGIVEMNEANTLCLMASLGPDAGSRLHEALRLYAAAGQRLSPRTIDYSRLQTNQATAYQKLAELGEEPTAHLKAAIELYRAACRRLRRPSPSYGRALAGWANAHRRLADYGQQPWQHLRVALRLCRRAARQFPPDSPEYVSVLTNQGDCWLGCVSTSSSPRHALARARTLYRAAYDTARASYPQGGFCARLLMRLGRIEEEWAGCLCRPQARLSAALSFYNQAYRAAKAGGSVDVSIYQHLAGVLLRLSNLGIAPDQNRDRAVRLYELAAGRVEADTPSWSRVRCTQAHVLHRSGRTQTAHQRLLEGLGVAERVRAGVGDAAGRSGYAETVAPHFGGMVDLCLDLSETGRTAAEKRQRHYEAWQWVHRSKGRVLMELLATARGGCKPLDAQGALHAPASVVPETSRLLARLRGLTRGQNGVASRTLAVEFFLTENETVAVFLVPLWGRVPLRTRRFPLSMRKVQCMHESLLHGDMPDLACLIDPWAADLRRLRPAHLLLAPHFHLNGLPLHAASWGGGVLAEQYTVSYLPALSLAAHLSPGPARPGGALVVGDPTGDLRSAAHEARGVAGRLARGGLSVETLLGDEAASTAVIAGCRTATILHFAGHSVFEPTDVLGSGLSLGDRRLPAGEAWSRLDLKDMALVFLNSCGAAGSVASRGDDLAALARLFLGARCQAVIAALWDVEDDVAHFFAVNLYRYWAVGGATLGVAFQRALLDVRGLYGHWRQWTPFVLIGSWQTPFPVNSGEVRT